MKLETPRLFIVALNAQQLADYLEPAPVLERSLGLVVGTRTVSDRVRQAIVTKRLPAVRDPATAWPFHTFWLVIEKQLSSLVAELCFKGTPNEAGEVEIGYATYPAHEGRGVMTEAVAALGAWALVQPEVTAVLAYTAPTNRASHRVLEKCGFERQQPTADNIGWRLR